MTGDKISISLPTDERGLIGRECPSCGLYFKLKLGTGLPVSICRCPYCSHIAESEDFFTQEQIDYIQSVALREIQRQYLDPMMRKMDRDLRRSSRDSMISISLKYRPSSITIKSFREQDLETDVTCAGCSLEFAVFTVFATCPDCGDPNALDVFLSSITVAVKRLHLADTIDYDVLRHDLIADAVGSGVSSFDTLGKELRRRYPSVIPKQPKNPFQNLEVVASMLGWDLEAGPFGGLNGSQRSHVRLMFQVRHLFEHNGGVVDEDFCRKVPNTEYLLGQRYLVRPSDVEELLGLLPELGRSAVSQVQKLAQSE